jgi:hypothetical protein
MCDGCIQGCLLGIRFLSTVGVASSLCSFISASLDLLSQLRARIYVSNLVEASNGLNRSFFINKIKKNINFKIAASACRVLASFSFTVFSAGGGISLAVIGTASFALSMAISARSVFLSKKNELIHCDNYFVREFLMR